MVQTRVCSYFQAACKHASLEPTTFLSLPEHLRHRIYFYQAEFTTDTPIHLSVWNGVPLFCAFNDYVAVGFASYYDLRLVSRVVKADIPRCLCSKYPILLCGAEMSSTLLPVLLDSPWNLLSCCRRLTIMLNVFTHHDAQCRCLYCHSSISDTNPPSNSTFDSTSNGFLDFLPTWKKIVDHLALSANVSKLELKLICDVEDSKAADLILGPLKQLKLSKCTLRLNEKYIPELEYLARQAVLRATSHNPAIRDPFRFLDLPTELRQRILSFTDLVTPFREIEWCLRFLVSISKTGSEGAFVPARTATSVAIMALSTRHVSALSLRLHSS